MNPEIKNQCIRNIAALGVVSRTHPQTHRFGDGSAPSSTELHPKGTDVAIWTGVEEKKDPDPMARKISISRYSQRKNGKPGKVTETLMYDGNGHFTLMQYAHGELTRFRSDAPPQIPTVSIEPLETQDENVIFELTQHAIQQYTIDVESVLTNSESLQKGPEEVVLFTQPEPLAS